MMITVSNHDVTVRRSVVMW